MLASTPVLVGAGHERTSWFAPYVVTEIVAGASAKRDGVREIGSEGMKLYPREFYARTLRSL